MLVTGRLPRKKLDFGSRFMRPRTASLTAELVDSSPASHHPRLSTFKPTSDDVGQEI
jgi:hypothetical protein